MDARPSPGTLVRQRNTPMTRCFWAGTDPLYCAYHDTEWGVPEHDSRALWEKLMLDGFQAGLAWITILRKREAFRTAFAGFEPDRVARFTEADVERLIGNARAYVAMRMAGEDFAGFVWSFVSGEPVLGDGAKALTRSPQSEALSGALRRRGFKFVGPVIVYAWMQACGLVDDHEETCFRRQAPRRAHDLTPRWHSQMEAQTTILACPGRHLSSTVPRD